MASSRLNKNLITIKRKPHIMLLYDRVIKEQLERGFIEEVPYPEDFSGKLHYIAHHSVTKDLTTIVPPLWQTKWLVSCIDSDLIRLFEWQTSKRLT